jgi:hypothetical protein
MKEARQTKVSIGQTSHGQVDGDLAINSMMWQNAGKSGLDQWNFTLQPTSKGQVMTYQYITMPRQQRANSMDSLCDG